MKWPKLIKPFGFNIHHTFGKSRPIIQIEKDEVQYKEKNNWSKYVVFREPNTSTSFTLEIKNITLDDAGFYSVGTTEDNSSLDRGFFLVVKGNYSIVSSV